MINNVSNARVQNCIALHGRGEKFAEAVDIDWFVRMPALAQEYTLNFVHCDRSSVWRVFPANIVDFVILAEVGNICGNTNDGPSFKMPFALIYKLTYSVVNRPTPNRRLIDGRPADRPTGPTKISRQIDLKSPSLSDVDLLDLVLNKQFWRNISEISDSSSKKPALCNILPFQSLILQPIMYNTMPNKRRKTETLSHLENH